MKRVLSSVGIGSANVDTILPKTSLEPGETVEATVEIEGGSAEQEIEHMYFALMTRYRTEDGYSQAVIDKFRVGDNFTIDEGEHREETVEVTVPYGTPLTMGNVKVWLKTGLDIDWAVDPKDTDHIEVRPDERMQALFDAVEDLGFSFYSAEVEKAPFGRSQPYAQEFEFKPRGGEFRGKLDELEVICAPTRESVTVYLEIDRRGGVLSEWADTDESKASFTFSEPDRDAIRDELESIVRRHA
ncbi:sporulation protein [Haloarchaeobius amylolyticus]|uniref:sporulation protein n=1 Tax=Haloarchaeobius amylolyticus TaxID=1198296 RepID=UPI002271D498|nr:sporulation protein [Haloarchaeobius amylolyticus]